MPNGPTVKCSECKARRNWLMLFGGKYLCQQCLDDVYRELVKLRSESKRTVPIHANETEPRDNIKYEYSLGKDISDNNGWECLWISKTAPRDFWEESIIRQEAYGNSYNGNRIYRRLRKTQSLGTA